MWRDVPKDYDVCNLKVVSSAHLQVTRSYTSQARNQKRLSCKNVFKLKASREKDLQSAVASLPLSCYKLRVYAKLALCVLLLADDPFSKTRIHCRSKTR